jgi:hypothetical protein
LLISSMDGHNMPDEQEIAKSADGGSVLPITSAEDFLTKSPLYVLTRVDEFYPPAQISFECEGICEKETTWYRTYDPVVPGREQGSDKVPDFSIMCVAYKCFRCAKTSLIVVYREMKFEERATTTTFRPPLAPPSKRRVLTGVMKLGQYPEPTIGIPKGLEKNLGKNASALYRKALVCRNHGFGLGAVGYMRRVVEDKTNELIEIAAQHAESHGVANETVANMRAAADPAKYTTYERKLEFVATVFPDSLKVGSINPLQLLYKLVSTGLHGLSEAECIGIADEIRTVFEYVFENLSTRIADQKVFVEKVKELNASN